MSNYFDHLLLLLSIRYGDGAGRPNTVKAPVTLSRNETEPAGITIFKIRDTFGGDSHLFLKKIRNAVRILRIHCEPASNDSCTFRVY